MLTLVYYVYRTLVAIGFAVALFLFSKLALNRISIDRVAKGKKAVHPAVCFILSVCCALYFII